MNTLKIRNLGFCEGSLEDAPEIAGGYTLGLYRGRKFYGTSSKSKKSTAKASIIEAPTAPVVEPTVTVKTTEGVSESGQFSVIKGSLDGSGTLSLSAGV